MGTRIYVGNLPRSTTSAELAQLFDAYGDVVDVRVITDRDTGQSKGFAFVEMSTEDAMRSAIEGLNGSMLGDRTLRLDEATERPTGRSHGANDRSRGGYSDRPRRNDRSRDDSW
jgi:RNA recognition motif-containing protein